MSEVLSKLGERGRRKISKTVGIKFENDRVSQVDYSEYQKN
ncbi:hypothetical protein [Desulfosediminicola flagellatus]|nr:hypothetical protein [Desulfosediminicola flagellatus]